MSADPNRPSASSSSSFYYQQQHQQQQQQQAGDDQDNIQLKPPIKKMRSFDTDSSDGGRTMPEDFEEGLGLLNNEVRPQPRNNNNFVPDYSFSSLNNNVYTADESTEMLEQQIMIDGKEVYTADRVDDIHQEDFRRSAMKEKQKKPPRKSFKDTIKSLFSRGNGVTDGSPRIIHINNKELNSQQKFMSNSVSTAKYNLFTFLPKFLYEEFSKSANVFFLFISGIQQIPNISPTSKYTTLVPLVIVLFITAIKEIIEDFGVHKSDRELNSRKCKIYDGSQFIDKPWRDLKVGDICRIDNSQFFPADLILLSSSEPEGLCYIETSNLDGEVNLKIKQALPETAIHTSPAQISTMSGVVKSEQPNNRLYNYDGTLTTANHATGGGRTKDYPLDPSMLLLRGAQLRNTSWIYGLVVFTGHETKLMLNSSKKPTKASNVTRITNRNILYLFAMLVTMSVLCSVGSYAISKKDGDARDYMMIPDAELGKEFGLNILTFMILFNSFIPISLMVTMEIVKYIQAIMIDNDLDIYYEKTDTPAVARSSSLIEELGQVEYVFSDKTGTLTCNEMEFRQCSIGGLSYATVPDPDKRPTSDNDPKGQYSFQQLETHLETSPDQYVINEFLTSLMTCHTVIPEMNEEQDKIIYQASSPDEAALVNGASDVFGYKFTARKPHSITCLRKGIEEEYQILNVCEFNSTRKRMSVVLRGPDGRVKLYCKGADTVILERLSKDNPFVEPTLEHLESYACEGLRTLCFAMRDISEDEYIKWAAIYEKASTTLVDRAQELDNAAELIEKDMFLLGATAIEDKLQDGVPDTIHTLHEANIKVWVLTGDRQETAINIGYSCKLLTEEMDLIICDEEDHMSTKAFLEDKLAHVMTLSEHMEHDPFAFIIEGKALTYALEKDLEKTFYDLATRCKAVVCCRVSPLQKALVVKVVKKFSKSILLAIGDGANDVSMIQAAHVGIGISGVEGLQAARSADFAISQFRFLKKLLLVHGAWAYQRLSKMIFFYFYKNVAMYLTQFWYAIFNGFSGQTLYESWTMSCFNVFFTFLPPMAIGIFDQFASARLLDKYPQMYILGQKNEFFNQKRFWGWIVNAVYHSALLYFIGMAAFVDDSVFTDGFSGGQWWVGTTIFTATLATILWKAALITDIWTKYTFIAIPGSMVIWFIFLPLVAYVGPLLPWEIFQEYYGIVPLLFGNVNFWLFFIVVPFACVLRDYIWKYIKRMYRPQSYHYIQEIQKYNFPDYRPRMDRFRRAVNKVRKIQRLKQSRGFAFAQNETDQSRIIRMYDTTQQKPSG
ncbi:aminophospholipid translocase [Mucor circinelloides]